MISRGEIEGIRYPNYVMNSVRASLLLKRNIKPLAKKYNTLRESIEMLGEELINNPDEGNLTEITSTK